MDSQIPANATKLTLLQLNGIKLDSKHTVLTPDYLENLENNGLGNHDEAPPKGSDS